MPARAQGRNPDAGLESRLCGSLESVAPLSSGSPVSRQTCLLTSGVCGYGKALQARGLHNVGSFT